MPFWNKTSTTLDNDVMYVNNTYKDANGNNLLSTIKSSNSAENYLPVSTTSTNSIVKNLKYAVQNDGKITYLYTDPAGGSRQFNSLQDLANAQIPGYTGTTTDLLKNSMQTNLSAAATKTNAGSPPAAAPDGPAATATPNSGATSSTSSDFNYNPNNAEQAAKLIGTRLNKYEDGSPLIYPLKRQGYGGDYISFEIRTYQKSGLASPTAQGRTDTKDVTLVGMEKRQAKTLAYIYLPIQSGISDSMSVDWGTGELSPITAAFANMAYSVINRAGQGDIGNYAKGAAKDFGNVLKGFGNASPELRAMMINYFVEQSVGVNGLLSRTIGGAINNNLELLFNGPTLRSFTFNFKLTAREPDEAVLIKNIIRYFKKSMVPGLSQSKLFLLAPNVFKIKYVYTGKGDVATGHPYLNKIKVAALRDMSINYTPDGNYMTYQDGSMTQYDLSLTFGEIDPIYEPDYEEGEGKEGMGW